jgi:hypothetical protein
VLTCSIRNQVGGRLIGERYDGDVGELRRLDDAAFDEAAEVDYERLAFEVAGPILDGRSRLQCYDAGSEESSTRKNSK